MSGSLSAARATWLLIRIRFRRVTNQFGAKRKKNPDGTRRATARKGNGGVLASGLFGTLIVASLTLQSWVTVQKIQRVVGCASPDGCTAGRGERLAALAGQAFAAPVLAHFSFELLALFAAAVFFALANREVAGSDWDMEWLATLPVKRRALVRARILERTIVAPAAWMALLPLAIVLPARSGHGLLLPLTVLAVVIPLAAMAGALHTLAETTLRVRFPASTVRNAQAVCVVLATLAFYAALSSGVGNRPLLAGVHAFVPSWAAGTPTGLAIRILTAKGRFPIAELLTLAAQGGLVVVLAEAAIARLLRRGIIAGGARDGSARRRLGTTAWRGERRLLSAVAWRELTLLGRDRTFLVQTLFMPFVIIGWQVLLRVRDGGAGAFTDPAHLAALAFGIGAYTTMFSAFQALNAEGQALWLLFTIPRSLETVLKDKARVWAIVATAFALAVLAAGVIWKGALSMELLPLALVALVGVPIYAVVATALGVFAYDPAQTEMRRIKPSYGYLFMLLASFYTYALYASRLSARLALMVLSLLFALALWQKARDHLPFILDPSERPPRAVSLADGIAAAMAFFVLQALLGLLIATVGGGPFTGTQLLVAFAGAGAITFAVAQVAFRTRHVRGVPATFGPGLGRAVALGAIGGGACAAVAVVYISIAEKIPSLAEELRQHVLVGPRPGLWIVPLAVIAAPLAEEFIFRGLIFGGLRRSFSAPAAVAASAAIFALVHPPISIIPVFVLGVVAALVYERTRLLAAPIAAHAVYNGVVVTLQLLGWR